MYQTISHDFFWENEKKLIKVIKNLGYFYIINDYEIRNEIYISQSILFSIKIVSCKRILSKPGHSSLCYKSCYREKQFRKKLRKSGYKRSKEVRYLLTSLKKQFYNKSKKSN